MEKQSGSPHIGSSFPHSDHSLLSVTITTFSFQLERPRCWEVGMGAWLPLTFFGSACTIGHGPRRERWVAPQSRRHPSLFSLSTPLLGFILSRGFNPYFIPLSACGDSGLQRAPLTGQSPRDGTGLVWPSVHWRALGHCTVSFC